MPLVAVYGTLKEGQANYRHYLSGEEPRFRGFVEIPFRMYANAEFPMLVPSEVPHRIFVEVFEIDRAKLETLDALETPYGYERESLSIAGVSERVEIYVHPDPPPPGFSLVEPGSWEG